jgi:hypothetical protein
MRQRVEAQVAAGEQDRQHDDVVDVGHGEQDHGGGRGVGAWLAAAPRRTPSTERVLHAV